MDHAGMQDAGDGLPHVLGAHVHVCLVERADVLAVPQRDGDALQPQRFIAAERAVLLGVVEAHEHLLLSGRQREVRHVVLVGRDHGESLAAAVDDRRCALPDVGVARHARRRSARLAHMVREEDRHVACLGERFDRLHDVGHLHVVIAIRRVQLVQRIERDHRHIGIARSLHEPRRAFGIHRGVRAAVDQPQLRVRLARDEHHALHGNRGVEVERGADRIDAAAHLAQAVFAVIDDRLPPPAGHVPVAPQIEPQGEMDGDDKLQRRLARAAWGEQRRDLLSKKHIVVDPRPRRQAHEWDQVAECRRRAGRWRVFEGRGRRR